MFVIFEVQINTIMKNILVLLISFFLITSCGIHSGTVMPMGSGIYSVTASPSPMGGGVYSLKQVRDKAMKEATSFAQGKDATLEIVAVNETPLSFGIPPQVDLTFRLVSESEKLADPNIESKTIIKSGSGNGKTTTKQTILKKDKSKKDDEKYDRLLKLGKLKEAGLLTQEEFDKEKKKILNDE